MPRFFTLAMLMFVGAAKAAEPEIADIRTTYRDGQTFVTWTDAAESEAGAKFRYSLYRSEKPIRAENLKDAE